MDARGRRPVRHSRILQAALGGLKMTTNPTRRSGPEPSAPNIRCAFCGGIFHSYCTTPGYWDTLWHPAGRTCRQAIDPTAPVVNFCHTCGRPNQATPSLIRKASHRRTSRFTLHYSFICDSYPTTVNHITVEVVGRMRDFVHAHLSHTQSLPLPHRHQDWLPPLRTPRGGDPGRT